MTDILTTHIRNNRLSYKLLLYILLASTLFTFIASAFHLYLEYRNDLRRIDETLAQIGTSYLSAIEASLWSYDTQQLKTQVQGILNLPGIVKAEICDASGGKGHTLISMGSLNARNIVEKHFKLRHEGDGVSLDTGTLTVYAGLDSARDRVFRQILSTVVMKVLEIFLLALFILVIFHHLIMKHLTRIAAFLKRVDVNALDVQLNLDRRKGRNKDILDFVVNAVNTILDYLSADIARRTETEERLRKINEDLEISKMEIEEQNRSKTRQMTVSDILREEENLEGLASRLVSCLCRFMDAGVGIFYRVDNLDGTVRAEGTYALNGKTAENLVWRIGEGGVGQAVKDRRKMMLERPEYSSLNVRSSLGCERPTHVVIFPFERKGVVTAAVEIGAFHPFSQEQILLLEQIGERVAMATEAAVFRQMVAKAESP